MTMRHYISFPDRISSENFRCLFFAYREKSLRLLHLILIQSLFKHFPDPIIPFKERLIELFHFSEELFLVLVVMASLDLYQLFALRMRKKV